MRIFKMRSKRQAITDKSKETMWEAGSVMWILQAVSRTVTCTSHTQRGPDLSAVKTT